MNEAREAVSLTAAVLDRRNEQVVLRFCKLRSIEYRSSLRRAFDPVFVVTAQDYLIDSNVGGDFEPPGRCFVSAKDQN
jgi:hypothetical protein